MQEEVKNARMGFSYALHMGFIAVTLAVGMLVVATPDADLSCEPARRLVVTPHEVGENQLVYCVMELDRYYQYQPQPRRETSTGECRATRKDADAVRDALAQTRQEALQTCLATRVSPPAATWNYAKRLWERVSD